jgi:hypothetical protein
LKANHEDTKDTKDTKARQGARLVSQPRAGLV